MAIFTGKLGTPGLFKLGISGAGALLLGPAFTGKLGTIYSKLEYIKLGTVYRVPGTGPQVYTVSVDQTLNLTQTLGSSTTYHKNVTQTFTLSQILTQRAMFRRSVGNTITISQTVTGVRSLLAVCSNTLHLTQTLTRQVVSHPVVSQILTFHQTLTRQVVYTANIHQTLSFNHYTVKTIPLTGQSITIPVAQAVVVKAKCTTILQIPSLAIVLPCPEFGDTQNNETSILIKRSMNNRLFSYIRTNSDLQKIKYTFQLGRLKSLELRQFVQAAMGEVVTLTNHKGEIWKGYITNNPVELVAKAKYENERERVDTSLEFQGIKIAG